MSEKHLKTGDALPPLEKDVLRIYSMLYCPFAQRPRLVLEHKGVPFETVNCDLKRKPSWLQELNPNGTVPVLQRNGQVLYESAIIMDYLDEAYPEVKLTPADPYIKAKAKILGEEFSKVIGPFYKALRSPNEEERRENLKTFQDKMEKFQNYMPDSKFLAGDEVSMVDYFCWPWFERFPLFMALFQLDPLPAEKFAKLLAWQSEMENTPGVKATKISIEDHVTLTMAYASGEVVDYDFRLKK